jgi:predicted RNA-binding Zn-ribbon protein involved in translation (DUF1610 family)
VSALSHVWHSFVALAFLVWFVVMPIVWTRRWRRNAGLEVGPRISRTFSASPPDLSADTSASPSRSEGTPPKQTKKCPDCAETVLADAKVCKHCNYRFATKNVRCHNCQHVWPVLVDLTKFKCENCGVRLRRNVGARDA